MSAEAEIETPIRPKGALEGQAIQASQAYCRERELACTDAGKTEISVADLGAYSRSNWSVNRSMTNGTGLPSFLTAGLKRQ